MITDIVNKKEFRNSIKRQIKAFDENYLETSNYMIFQNAMKLPEIADCDRILICSMGREVDTRRIIDAMFASGKTVALPVCEGEGIMHFSELRPGGLKVEGMYGILEPEKDSPVITPRDGDVILVPALTFDKNGYRMGKGSGYYDRFLKKRDFISIGLARDRLLVDSVPRQEHDMQVKILVTDRDILRFS